MPDKRMHRGPHPEDETLFAREAWPRLRGATEDLCWLLSRGYATASALKLVGDRYQLLERQRIAVGRCACAEADRARREAHRVEPAALAGQTLLIDGYNLLTTIEAALGGGVILAARDGCFRDMASMHGTYRKVAETVPALQLAGEFLAELSVASCVWHLDSPVSNSGRLKGIMHDVAAASGWNWTIELTRHPDAVLAAASEIVVTADSAILDRCERWANLARAVVTTSVPQARVVCF